MIKREEGGRLLLVGKVWLLTFLVGSVSSTVDRYDQVGGASHPYESYASPGWGGEGGKGGSYYHYHVPLVQNQGGWGGGGGSGWGWQPEGQKGGGHDILLWALAFLLLLAALGSLLLPLLLIPLGLSLLALLLGGMMMMAGGGMMMMMMMMMMPQPQAARTELVGRALDTVEKLIKGDTEAAFTNILSTMEMDNYCPEKALCNLGLSLSSLESLGESTNKILGKNVEIFQKFFKNSKQSHPHVITSLIQNILPLKSKQSERVIRRMEKAFWAGMSNKNCTKMENRCKNLQKMRELKYQHNNHTPFANNSTEGGAPEVLHSTHESKQMEGEKVEEIFAEDNAGESKKNNGFFLLKPTFSTPTIRM